MGGDSTGREGEHVRGGAAITTTEPAGVVSTKWEVSLGAAVSVPSTICTVYAGPHMRVVDASAEDGEGERMWISGMWPPWGTPSLIRASESSQVENLTKGEEEEDMARTSGWRRCAARCMR